MDTDTKLSEIGQIDVTVSDVGTALQFYRDVLGLLFLFSPSSNLAFLDAGGVRIMLSTLQGAGTVGKTPSSTLRSPISPPFTTPSSSAVLLTNEPRNSRRSYPITNSG